MHVLVDSRAPQCLAVKQTLGRPFISLTSQLAAYSQGDLEKRNRWWWWAQNSAKVITATQFLRTNGEMAKFATSQKMFKTMLSLVYSIPLVHLQ